MTSFAEVSKTELAERFKYSHSTITRYLKKHIKNNNFASPDSVSLIMDTTYSGSKYGVMALFDARTKQTLSVDEEVRFLAWNAQPYLFVFEDFPDLNTPNTTNLLEEKFKDVKRLLNNHQGMRKDNKILFIKDFLSLKQSK